MKKKLFLLGFLFLLAACADKKAPESYYDKAGIVFTSPAGWEITEEEDFDETSHYLALEKQGFSASGLVTVTWYETEMDLEELMEMIKNSLADNSVFDGLTFTDIPDAEFNGMTALGTDYTMTVQGLAHRGEVYVFGKGDTCVGLIKQESAQDHKRNAEGFETFEKSFSLK